MLEVHANSALEAEGREIWDEVAPPRFGPPRVLRGDSAGGSSLRPSLLSSADGIPRVSLGLGAARSLRVSGGPPPTLLSPCVPAGCRRIGFLFLRVQEARKLRGMKGCALLGGFAFPEGGKGLLGLTVGVGSRPTWRRAAGLRVEEGTSGNLSPRAGSNWLRAGPRARPLAEP